MITWRASALMTKENTSPKNQRLIEQAAEHAFLKKDEGEFVSNGIYKTKWTDEVMIFYRKEGIGIVIVEVLHALSD